MKHFILCLTLQCFIHEDINNVTLNGGTVHLL